jgi:NAD(P)H-hydrate epimerase
MPEPIYLGRDIPSLDREISKASAVLIGCGLGTGEDSVETFKYVLNTVKCPTVIDADGINILASRIDIDTIRGRNIVLTPHPLEMSRLTNMSVEDVQNNRFEVAITFAKKYQCVLVLKGANSIITNGEDVYIDTHPNSGLAKGGSGDVLAGIISSFMAQGLSPFEASKLGVYLHSQCGLACAERLTEYSCLPTDLIEEIPNQIKGMSIEVILR